MSVSPQEIKDLRESFLEELQAKGEACVHPADLNRIKSDDNWIKRFLMHHDNDQKLALAMMWEVTEWRKSFKTNEISEATVRMDYMVEGGFFTRGRDKDGAAIFIFKCKKHVKGTKDMDELKKCVVYWFERLERQEKGKPITIFFDMEGCGLSNMDMEFTKYLIGLFKQYYPYFLNYIIIYEMAWILNAAFSVIKSWLPEKAVLKIKMLKKANIDTYVPLEEALKCWGGQDDYVYSFVPETINEAPTSNSATTNKKVHFADGSPMSEAAGGDKDSDTFSVLSISPSSVINFLKDDQDEYVSNIDLRNTDSTINISYKMKTTAPEKFRVRPSAGILCPGDKVTITVTLLPAYQLGGLAKDKFLIMSMPIDNPNMTSNDVVDLWKNTTGKNVKQNRLRCTPNNEMNYKMKNGSAGQLHPSIPEQNELVKLTSSVAKLHDSQQSLHKAVKNTQVLQYLTMGLVVVLGIVLYFIVNRMLDSDSGFGSCLRKSEL